jgi:hypothetical protein
MPSGCGYIIKAQYLRNHLTESVALCCAQLCPKGVFDARMTRPVLELQFVPKSAAYRCGGDASAAGMPMREALQTGLARMRQIAGANPGDRTMVDALLPTLDALDKGLAKSAKAAREGADYTATLTKAEAGRSTYINADQLTGHVDPGAEAVARLFEHLAS